MPILVSFVAGLIFAMGLGISGMTQPQKIIGFLNVTGNWDPSLILVMLGAVGVYLIGHALILKRSRPVFEQCFAIPERSDIDRPLVLGSALFGIGWGLVGFCPGPVLASLVTANENVLLFVFAMAVGMYANDLLNLRLRLIAKSEVG